MSNTKTRARAESLFDRERRREVEIAGALEQERGRHEAVIRNMERLKALRLRRDADGNGQLEVRQSVSAAKRHKSASHAGTRRSKLAS